MRNFAGRHLGLRIASAAKGGVYDDEHCWNVPRVFPVIFADAFVIIVVVVGAEYRSPNSDAPEVEHAFFKPLSALICAGGSKET